MTAKRKMRRSARIAARRSREGAPEASKNSPTTTRESYQSITSKSRVNGVASRSHRKTHGASIVTRQGPSSKPKKKSELYRYLPLDTATITTIRTLELHVGPGKALKCTIHHAELGTVAYQALSYVWGNPLKSHRIAVTDHDGGFVGYVALTENVFHALQDLRNSPEIESKMFWIDQISINQEDEQERGHQVALMGKIYKQASRVITYLGPATQHDAEVFWLLAAIRRHFSPCYEHIAASTSWRDLLDKPDILPVSAWDDDRIGDQSIWIALLDMTFGGWTRRAWMVQENLLNTSSVMLRGIKTLNWLDVAVVPILFGIDLLPRHVFKTFCRSAQYTHILGSVISLVYVSWCHRWHHFRYVSEDSCTVNHKPLFDNMTWYSALQCHDQRDHVYALLGISSDTLQLGITPNYKLSIPSVYRDTTLRIMKQNQSLEHFEYLSLLENISYPEYKSWSLNPHVLVRLGNLLDQKYNAHPVQEIDVAISDTNVMLLRGQIIDQIVLASPLITRSDEDIFGLSTAYDMQSNVLFLAFISSLVDNLGLERTILEQICCAVTCSSDWPPQTGPRPIANALFGDSDPVCAFCVTMQDEWNYIRNHRRTVSQDLHELFTSIEKMFQRLQKEPRFTQTTITRELGDAMWHATQVVGRCLAVTNNSAIINACGKTQVGDVIALLRGSRWPCILRPVGGERMQYQILGIAWVNGMMYGEAYNNGDPDELDYEIEII